MTVTVPQLPGSGTVSAAVPVGVIARPLATGVIATPSVALSRNPSPRAKSAAVSLRSTSPAVVPALMLIVSPVAIEIVPSVPSGTPSSDASACPSALIRSASRPPPAAPSRRTSDSHPAGSANRPASGPTGTAPPSASWSAAENAAAIPVRASAASSASPTALADGAGTSVSGGSTGAAATVSVPAAPAYVTVTPATVSVASIDGAPVPARGTIASIPRLAPSAVSGVLVRTATAAGLAWMTSSSGRLPSGLAPRPRRAGGCRVGGQAQRGAGGVESR